MGASTAYKADGSWTCCLQAPSSAERPGISTEKQHRNISSQHACVLWPNADVSPPHHVPPYVMDRPAAIQLPHRGEHLPWPSTSCDCWAQSWQTRCPCPQLSELTWLVHVHILTEVMNIIPFHWQMLGELLTISLLLFCGELGQSHGMLAEVVYLQHVQWSWSKVRGKIC